MDAHAITSRHAVRTLSVASNVSGASTHHAGCVSLCAMSSMLASAGGPPLFSPTCGEKALKSSGTLDADAHAAKSSGIGRPGCRRIDTRSACSVADAVVGSSCSCGVDACSVASSHRLAFGTTPPAAM